MPFFTDPDTVFRGTTGALVPATWTDTVNDDLNALYGPTTWTSLSGGFSNGWGNYSSYTAKYQVVGQVCFLDGLISSGTLGAVALQVPPQNVSTPLLFAVTSNHAFGDIRIDPGGQLIPFTGDNTWFALTGISYICNP